MAPQSVEEFLQAVFAKTWAHYPGQEDRFRDLADWGVLSDLLATQRFESPRFRVAKEGVVLPIGNYTEEIDRRANSSYRRIVVDSLLRALRQGATLTFDRVDQAHLPIRKLALMLELELRATVFVNIFASWNPVPGFDVHWDDHDVFVIQLAGHKHWQIFEPTRQWPLYKDIVENPFPQKQPAKELDMSPGDVLYLPHGWWHGVQAMGEPSLHLTFGVSPANGINLLTWLVDRARADELFRGRLPRFASATERNEYVDSFRHQWNELMANQDLMEDFFAYSDGTSPCRLLFELRDILSINDVINRRGARIELLAPRATLTWVHDNYILGAFGRRWAFPRKVKPLIEALISGETQIVSDVLAANDQLEEAEAAEVIFELLKAGIIVLKEM